MAMQQGLFGGSVGNLNSVPAPQKQTLSTNYIDFIGGSDSAGINDWRQQYLPELMEAEAEVFGNRTISGFLSQVGAEESLMSDQVVWSEQGRLHLNYSGTLKGTNGTLIQGLPTTHAIRVGDTVVVASAAADKSVKCYVTHTAANSADATDPFGSVTVGAAEIKVLPYTAATLQAAGITTASDPLQVFVYGSEFAKGKTGRTEVITPSFTSFSNKPVIIKEKYEISGSDAAQIGWVEVSGEDGQSGYMWYLKAEGDTRQRFADNCEMTCIEAEKAANTTLTGQNIEGTEGLFAAITDRGLVNRATLSKAEFDVILGEFDGQGAIEENMMYMDRTESLVIDDMLAGIDGGNTGAGSAYGVFNNSEDMALNLGFTGFRRGSYDFYKTDWKYLNDFSTRGLKNLPILNTSRVRGVIAPAGVSSVYDENMGRNIKRPFLHVRYRASQTDDRKFKSWVTGSVGGNITSDLDAMEVHYLSERCLVVQGANNFCLLD
jgi:hypothetical protein